MAPTWAGPGLVPFSAAWTTKEQSQRHGLILVFLNHPALLEKYDKTVRDRLSKVCNVILDIISSTQLAVPSEMCGLGVSSASLVELHDFLASAFDASDSLTTISTETFADVSFKKALEKWLSLTIEREIPLRGTKEFRTQLVNVKTSQDLISRMDDKRSEVFSRRFIKWNATIIVVFLFFSIHTN